MVSFSHCFRQLEKCQSGLSCFLAKEVGFTPPEVRILSSPRAQKTTRQCCFPIFSHCFRQLEKCQSGLSCFLAKEVGFTPPEVRILSSPRAQKTTRQCCF